eukprot:gene4415-4836_t
MADEFLRSKLYEYGANSNLVLEAERDGRRNREAGKGEVESLRGKLGTFKMGDRLQGITRSEEDFSRPPSKKARLSNEDGTHRVARAKLELPETDSTLSYVPKSAETRAAFEEMLVEVRSIVGDQPHDILVSATTEVLTVLKNASLSEAQKLSEIRQLTGQQLNSLSKLTSISRKVTDFVDEVQAQPVQSDRPVDEEMAVGRGDVAVAQTSTSLQTDINVHDIDAYWLQRQLSKYYSEATISSRLAEEALAILATADERLCENQLVVLLDFDKFDLIKFLLRNRAKIYYCIKLKQAQSAEERRRVEEEMQQAGGEAQGILALLNQKVSAGGWVHEKSNDSSNKGPTSQNVSSSSKNLNVMTEEDEDGAAVGGRASALQQVNKTIKLDDYSFSAGSHLMSNTRCTLPEQSWRAQKKGFEEVHVPALKPAVVEGEKLEQVTDLPDWMQPVFEGIRNFNRVQSKLLGSALYGEDNMLLCAPTGSGKTNVALLCMMGMINRFRGADGKINTKDFKIVYIAPMKALVQECVLTFGKRLAPLNMQVRELSGDQSLSRQEIVDTQVIVTTPEKWDIVTRKVTERSFAQVVRLVIIDEVHLLHDDRGPVLEALVARMIRNAESTHSPVRLVGLSATLPNYKDVAAFLHVKPQDLHFFDNSYRPVPLQQQFIGVMEKKALKRVQLMNEICYEKALVHGTKNQLLIFTHSRADTVKTARALRDMAADNDTLSRFLQEGSASHEILKVEAGNAKNADLKELLSYGFAVHHAGLARSDRTLVEDLFADKHIKVLISTATLAWGVNLPCRTVIIKGTQMYSPNLGRWTELSPLDILQMMGRAGRYGLDSEGEGIIITDHSELQYYLSLMNQQLPIESHLVSRLPDILNAEIVLGTVSSLDEAVEWLGYSYFFVRMLRRPLMYGCSEDDIANDPTFIRARSNFAHAALVSLDKTGLAKYDRRTGAVASSYLGKIASYYYITAESLALYNENLRSSMNEVEVFRLFSLSAEFKHIHVRDEEKIELRSLIYRVPIPIKESVEEPSAKINVLLQAYISRLKLEGFALLADMQYIQQSACRILRALFEIALKKEWAALAVRLLELCIMTERRMWKSQCSLRQFAAIPDVISRKLEKISTISWDKYADLSPQDLGELVKIPKMGKTLHKFVHMIPKLKLNVNVYPLSRSLLRFEVTSELDFELNDQIHGRAMLFWLFVEDADREHILYSEPIMVRSRTAEYFLDFTVPLFEPRPPHYFITVMADRWLHSTVCAPVSFRRLVLPPKFPPPSELLDLQALPIASLKNSDISDFFAPIQYLNPVQTQCYIALYENDANVLVCAPHGSGKTLCGELAILRALSLGPGKIIYIPCNQDQAEVRYKDWCHRFQKLSVSVALLEGDQLRDLELMKSAQVVISSPSVWESLSRKWRQRKIFRTIQLFVFDDLHSIGSEGGACLEIALARTRFMITQLQNSARIVGLSYCIANAKDVGDVIGAASSAVFNFPPNARPFSLDVRIHGVDEIDYSNRLQAVQKPALRMIISAVLSGERTLVFAPSRKHAQMLAIDIITQVEATGKEEHFKSSLKELGLESSPFQDKALAQTLEYGVGYLYDSMEKVDMNVLETLFSNNGFKVLIIPYSMAFKISTWAPTVLILDTVVYDGASDRFVDLRVNEIWQMVSRAGHADTRGKCAIFCHSSRKERLRTFLHDLVPLESHMDHALHDFLNAEVVSQTITSKADAVDFLTWTFYYRRLAQNPNYYNLSSAGHHQLSDHLSELIESAVNDLEESKCLAVENDMDLSPLNLGMIAAFYSVSYTTVELFSSSVTSKSKFKAITEILAAVNEVSQPLRLGEEQLLSALAGSLGMDFAPNWENAGADIRMKKALLLLHSQFNRVPANGELRVDQLQILKQGVLLVQALVDVISSQGWLKPALAAMEVSQCIVQGMKVSDPTLMQIPHFSVDLVKRLQVCDPPVETVFDLLDMEDDEREKLLAFSPSQLSEIALFCNAYPVMQVSYSTSYDATVSAEETISITVTCTRDSQDDAAFDPTVVSAQYPFTKKEAWWIVVGDPSSNILYSVKRFVANVEFKAVLEFTAPESPGDYNLNLYLICDSYIGCDQEYELLLTVV